MKKSKNKNFGENLLENYKNFLDNGKTERECVAQIIEGAKANGYVDISQADTLKAGDKVFVQKMNKVVALFEIGSENIENGLNILGAHIDSPRLDAKQNPIYEKDFITIRYTLLWGYQKIPMGNNAACNSWHRVQSRRNSGEYQRGRR